MPIVQIVILAKSVKHGCHCVAGKCINTGRWYRPVSSPDGAELNNDQVMYRNIHGTYSVRPLQKIQMSFLSHVPLIHQPENYLIDVSIWQQRYKINIDELYNYLEQPESLWGEGNRVSYNSILSGEIAIQQSLYLVQVQNLSLYCNQEGKRRASFTYNGLDYDLAVTDPNFDTVMNESSDIRGVLCISLGEEYNGFCYKLIATIF